MAIPTQTPALSGVFSQLEVADYLGVFQDLTPYTQQIDITRGSDPTDITTGVAGGGRIAETIIRGAAHSEFTLKFLYDLQLVLILRQILWQRAGARTRLRSSANAGIGQGDVLFLGDMLWVTNHLTGTPGSNPMTVDCDICPADSGAIVIPFYTTV